MTLSRATSISRELYNQARLYLSGEICSSDNPTVGQCVFSVNYSILFFVLFPTTPQNIFDDKGLINMIFQLLS